VNHEHDYGQPPAGPVLPRAAQFGRRTAGITGGSPEMSEAARQFAASLRTEQQPRTSEIDFTIGGNDSQYVEVELDPGEAVIAENGAMIWKDYDVEMSLVMGDGSNDEANFAQKIGNAGRAALSGESLYMTQFMHRGAGRKARVALGGKSVGEIVAVRLDTVGGTLICRRGAFLAAAKGVALDARFQRRLTSALLGHEGLLMQGITGTGWVFLHVGGALIEKELTACDYISVDSGCVVAHEASVDMSIGMSGGAMASLAGGEGFSATTLKGPGKVWIQTLPPEVLNPPVVGPSIAAGILGGLGQEAAEGVARGIAAGGLDLVRKIW
jgi:uncharacterized protein (AIM24 family)